MQGSLALLFFAGCSQGYHPEPSSTPTPPTSNLRLSDLTDYYQDGVLLIEEPLVVAGRVTTSDEAGNFYRTLLIEDSGAALEVRVGSYHLHNRYPIGCQLTINLKGLALERSLGVLQAGLLAEAYDYPEVGYLGAQALIDQHLFRGEKGDTPTPAHYHIGELREEYCGTLIAIEGLRYTPLEEEEPLWAGYRRFTDSKGRAIHSHTGTYARFAADPIPRKEVTLCGILQYVSQGEHKGFVIKPRSEADWIEHP